MVMIAFALICQSDMGLQLPRLLRPIPRRVAHAGYHLFSHRRQERGSVPGACLKAAGKRLEALPRLLPIRRLTWMVPSSS
jgi:hypothetical protein